ncbi:MAG: hypothetical protein ACREA0_02590 [bacterium]
MAGRLTAWLACKKSGTHYRYYLTRENKEHAGPRWWPGDPTLPKAHITVAMFRLGQILDQLSPVEQPRIARLLVEKMIVLPCDIGRGHPRRDPAAGRDAVRPGG